MYRNHRCRDSLLIHRRCCRRCPPLLPWPQSPGCSRLFVCFGGQSRGGHTTGPVSAAAYLHFVIGDPVPDCDFHHLALALRAIETESGIQGVWCLLVVVEHEVSTHSRHGYREADPQTPARNVDFMDCLVADFTVPGVPDPMPVVVKAITRERLKRSGAGPEVVINAGRNGFHRSVPDGWPPLVAKGAGHVHVADGAVAQLLNGFQHSRVRSRLAAVLANSAVLFYGTYQLSSFKPVMRAGLFYIHIFAGLARPDGH